MCEFLETFLQKSGLPTALCLCWNFNLMCYHWVRSYHINGWVLTSFSLSPNGSLLMYGYAISGAETMDSWFANATGHPIPDGFTKSAIPSLLFGSLISATDPGKIAILDWLF